LLATTLRAVELLEAALTSIVVSNDAELWNNLAPGADVCAACEDVMQLFVYKLPSIVAKLDDDNFRSVSSQAACDECVKRATMGRDESTNRTTRSATRSDGAARAAETTSAAGVKAQDGKNRATALLDTIKRGEDDLAQLEKQLAQNRNNPDLKSEIKAKIRVRERQLLNDRLALTVFESSGELRSDVVVLQNQVVQIVKRQDESEADSKQTKSEMAEFRIRLEKLEREKEALKRENKEIWKTMDAVDNTLRKQSLALHGVLPDEDAADLFPEHIADRIDRVYSVGIPTPRNGSRTTIVHFTTVSGCDMALDFLNSSAFDTNRSRVSYARNTSNLARIGGTRLRLIGDKLAERFPGADVKHGALLYKKVRYQAVEFAMQTISIDGVAVDLDKLVASCDLGETNAGVAAYVDGRRVNGIRMKRRRVSTPEREGGDDEEFEVGNRANTAVAPPPSLSPPLPSTSRPESGGQTPPSQPSAENASSSRTGDHEHRRGENAAQHSQSRAKPRGGQQKRNDRGGGNSKRGRGAPAYRGGQQRYRGNLTRAPPPLDERTKGGVRVFVNGGYKNHGRNNAYDHVMCVSGYPPRSFQNSAFQSWHGNNCTGRNP
jgi:hypothetical protein